MSAEPVARRMLGLMLMGVPDPPGTPVSCTITRTENGGSQAVVELASGDLFVVLVEWLGDREGLAA